MPALQAAWEEPADAEIAESLRQMMAAMVKAGEDAIKAIFEEKAAASQV